MSKSVSRREHPWISSISSRDERVSEHAPVLAASRIETLQQATT